jgi:twitching motility protein PilT
MGDDRRAGPRPEVALWPEPVPSVRDPRDIHELLQQLVARGASDLHVKVGSRPGLRIDGTILPVGRDRLGPDDTRRMVGELLGPERMKVFEETGDLDFSHAIPGLSRFRVNALVQRGTMGVVVRRIDEEDPNLVDLGLPKICAKLAEGSRGLVLVTGPAGAGKSTTLAAMLNHINCTRRGHIVTMEDPIEFVHTDRLCWVTQREVGSDVRDFPGALRRALRQDPDAIMIGEMRDLETIALACTAAETGHLVFATLHTTSAVQTINRVVDVFPADQQEQIRLQLAETLQGVLSQTLLPRINGGQVVAMEILVANEAVRATIRENKTPQLRNLMQTGAREGMQTLEKTLSRLLEQGVISYETALAKANFPKELGRAPTGSR